MKTIIADIFGKILEIEVSKVYEDHVMLLHNAGNGGIIRLNPTLQKCRVVGAEIREQCEIRHVRHGNKYVRRAGLQATYKHVQVMRVAADSYSGCKVIDCQPDCDQ